jgi:hypothetical protein
MLRQGCHVIKRYAIYKNQAKPFFRFHSLITVFSQEQHAVPLKEISAFVAQQNPMVRRLKKIMITNECWSCH